MSMPMIADQPTQNTAQVLAGVIRECLQRGGRCYVSRMGGTNQARRIYRARRIGRNLQLYVTAADRMEWYVVVVRDVISIDKATAQEQNFTVGAL